MVRKAPSEPIVTVTVSQGIGLHATLLVAPSAVRELNGSFSRANSRGAGVDARSEAFGPMNGCCLAISPYELPRVSRRLWCALGFVESRNWIHAAVSFVC